MKNFYGFIVALILVTIIYFQQSIACYTLLSGFWEADTSFCEESGLDLFCIYFSDDYNKFGSRPCYILASQNDSLVLNEPTVATISMQWLRRSNYKLLSNSPIYFNITFKHIDEECVDVFPKHQQMRFYPVCGKIVLFYNSTITAVLYKNPLNTELKTISNIE